MKKDNETYANQNLQVLVFFDGTKCFDCGLRLRNTASETVEIACSTTATNALKIRSGGTTYNVVLVDTADPMASKARVQTSAGTKALRCLYSGCGES